MKKLLKEAQQRFRNLSIGIRLGLLFGLCCTLLLFFNYLSVAHLTFRNAEINLIDSNVVAVEQVRNNFRNSCSTILRYLTELRTEVQEACRSLVTPDTPKEYTDHYNIYVSLYNRMVTETDSYPLIDSMQIVNANGDVYTFSLLGKYSTVSTVGYDTLLPLMDDTREYQWARLKSSQIASDKKLVSIFTSVRRFGNVYSIIVVNFNEEYIQQFLQSCNLSGESLFYDTVNQELIASPESMNISQDVLLEALEEMGDNSYYSQNDYLIISQSLIINEWRLVNCIRWQTLLRSTESSRNVLLITLFGTVFAAMLISIFIAKSVSRPLKKLTRLMGQVEKDQLSLRFSPRYKDEIGILAASFDRMMDEIQGLTERIREEEKQQKATYMKLLQMQIKPHFLYNSLETTRFMVEMNAPQAVTMIKALSCFYKLMLGNISETTAVKEEVDQLEAYLTIMSIRYSSRFRYEMDVQPDTLPCQIIRFLLQPLVENAIYHGVKLIRRPGLIRISIQRDQGNLLIQVWDNGKGISHEVLEKLQHNMEEGDYLESGKSIGLVSVHQRLALTYGAPYGLRMESVEDSYTLVSLRAPCIL